MRFSIFLFLFAGFSSSAFAHWGHVGELAGHGHVIAIGALVGAAALAAALLKPKGEKAESEDEAEETEGEKA